MSTFDSWSIADLKAALDFLEDLKSEKLQDLRERGIESKDDTSYGKLEERIFKVHNSLFSRVVKI